MVYMYVIVMLIFLYLYSVLGSVLVMVGLYILLWGKKKEMQNRLIKNDQEAQEIKEQDSQIACP